MGSPLTDPEPPAAATGAANEMLDGLWADLGLGAPPSDGNTPLSTPPMATANVGFDIDLDGTVPKPPPATAPTTVDPAVGYLPADFEFPSVRTPPPTDGMLFTGGPPPPPPPAAFGMPSDAVPFAAPPPAAADPRQELEALSRLSGSALAGELCRIARELEGQGCVADAVRVWRAAQLLDPLSNDAALALVRLTS